MGLFSRTTKLASSGNDEDDELLRLIAEKSDLDAPREWVHYLYFPDERSARDAGRSISDSGWGLQLIDKAASDDDEWIVIPERPDAVLSPSAVREAREYFQGLTARVPGATYDGWEASL